jgi:hypothetical protein
MRGKERRKKEMQGARSPASLAPSIDYMAPTSLAPLSNGVGVGGGALCLTKALLGSCTPGTEGRRLRPNKSGYDPVPSSGKMAREPSVSCQD